MSRPETKSWSAPELLATHHVQPRDLILGDLSHEATRVGVEAALLRNARELAGRVVATAPQVSGLGPSLAAAGTVFHERAGTLTPAVARNIQRLCAHKMALRVAHQPNTFAALNVYAQYFQLTATADRIERDLGNERMPVVHLVLDCDSADDRRFRTAAIPDIDRRGGLHQISALPARGQRNLVMHAAKRPDANWLTMVTDWATARAKRDDAIARRFGLAASTRVQTEAAELLRHDVVAAAAQSNSLAEFNATFASRIANLRWGLDIVFVPMSSILGDLTHVFEFAIARHEEIAAAFDTASTDLARAGVVTAPGLRVDDGTWLFWYICDCDRRVALGRTVRGCRLEAAGSCSFCGAETRLDLGTSSRPDIGTATGRLVPRAVLQDLSDAMGGAFAGGSTYITSSSHGVVTAATAAHLGLRPIPELYCRAIGSYAGTTEYRVAHDHPTALAPAARDAAIANAMRTAVSGSASIMYYLLGSGATPLSQSWLEYCRSTASVGTPATIASHLPMSPALATFVRAALTASQPNTPP